MWPFHTVSMRDILYHQGNVPTTQVSRRTIIATQGDISSFRCELTPGAYFVDGVDNCAASEFDPNDATCVLTLEHTLAANHHTMYSYRVGRRFADVPPESLQGGSGESVLEKAHLVVVFDGDHLPQRAQSVVWPEAEQDDPTNHRYQRQLVRRVTVHDSEKALLVTFQYAIELMLTHVPVHTNFALLWER